MIRSEIRQRFRDENPEVTPNVASDITLNSWMIQGDKEICAKARLIVDSGTIDAIDNERKYDLTQLTKFYDIDEIPGGGVSIVDSNSKEKRMDKTSKSALDNEVSNWRTASSGTPKQYFRRGKYLNFDKPIDILSVDSINVDFICISDDFNNDNITPYNQLTYLEPFHPAIVFYLTWRAKAKVAKPDEVTTAMNNYNAFVAWMRTEIGGGKYGPIEYRPSGQPSAGQYR